MSNKPTPGHNWHVLATALLFWGLIISPFHLAVAGDMVITYRRPESTLDKRYDYDNAVLKLALEKTKETWGGYKLIPSPVMNYSRALKMIELEKFENPMFKYSASNEMCASLSYAPFPIDLGIVGYRLFFVARANARKISSVKTIEELKQYSIGQGAGWLDIKILKNAGFTVETVSNYESLFHMVALQRFDLLSRGVNEVENEFTAFSHVEDLVLNRDIGIYYPLPRFFFTNKKSTEAAKRVYEGLFKAHQDGSLQALWKKKYQSSIDFVDINKIRFFKIKNIFIDRIDPSYQDFIIKF